MTVYEYQSDDGEVIERELPMTRAPKIGSRLVKAGKVFYRLPPKVRTRVEGDHHFASHSLPLNWPYAPRHDKLGRPLFANKREVDEAVSRGNHEGEDVAYDHGGGTGT